LLFVACLLALCRGFIGCFTSVSVFTTADVQTHLPWDKIRAFVLYVVPSSLGKSLMSRNMVCCFKMNRQRFPVLDRILHMVNFRKTTRQCTYNLTLRRVRIIIVAVEKDHHHHHHHHHHHLANLQLGHLLTHSGLTLLEVSLLSRLVPSAFWSVVFYYSLTYYKAFSLYVANSVLRIPVFCSKLGLYLVLLRALCLCFNLSKFILLLFSYISSLLLLFFLQLLL
jgi:hypothetical protein